MLKVQRNSKGFTLIELLIVIAIIGILAAIAIPAYSSYTKRAKVQEVIHSMGAVKTAVMAYYTEAGEVPAAANADVVKETFGIDVPVKFLESMTVTERQANQATGGVINAVFYNGANTATKKSIGSGVSGETITLTPDAAFKQWTWSKSSGLDDAYLPKN
ncbi:MAG: prepilin-type N-terminal cleavage/methylation domain-containing protein [Syntrophorhabdus sp.]|nr:prepilin-type N-terminal cleavage/methylation domain-containing protein [Syntrophorhabdus sp.]